MLIFGCGEMAWVIKYKLECTSSFLVHREFIKPDMPSVYAGYANHVSAYEDQVRAMQEGRPVQRAIILGIGPSQLNRTRERIYHQLKADGFMVEGFDNGKVVGGMLSSAILMELVNIQPFATIGENVVIWSHTHIGHHARIGSHSFITSMVCIAGGAKIGERCFVGCGAVVNDHVTVGDDCIIQAGSVVDRDVPAGSVWTREGLSKVPSSKVKL